LPPFVDLFEIRDLLQSVATELPRPSNAKAGSIRQSLRLVGS
jgi:hypothetical protein